MTVDRNIAAELAEAVRTRVAQRVRDARRRIEANRRANTDKRARRIAGLNARHARKLNRINERTPDGDR